MTDPRRGDEAAARHAVEALNRIRAAGRELGDHPFYAWYTAAIGVALLVSMVLAGSRGLLDGVESSAPAASAAGPTLALATAVGAIAALVLAVQYAGPVAADGARLAWLHASGADRRLLLRPRYVGACLVGAAVGGVAGATCAVLAAADPATAVAAVASGALAGAAVVAAGAAAQPEGRGAWPGRGAVAALVVSAVVAVAALRGAPLPSLGTGPALLFPALGLAVAGTAVVFLAVGDRRLGDVRGRDLRAAGENMGSVGDSVLSLDATAVTAHARSRHLAGHGRRRSRRGRGVGARAVAHREAVRLLRRPAVLIAAAVTVPLPAAASVAAGRVGSLIVGALVAAVLAPALARGYTAWATSAGLARALPLPRAATATALLAAPMLWWSAWTLGASALAGAGAVAAGALACSGLAAALDAAVSRAVGRTGVVVATPAGALQTGLIQQSTGWAVPPLLAVLPAVLWPHPPALLLCLGVCVFYARR